MMIATLLPLKVIMMLGTESVPKINGPLSFIYNLDRETLILLLSALVIMFYIVANMSEKLAISISKKGAKKILKVSNKIVLFENQDEIISKAYIRFTESISSLFFATLAICLVLYLYQMSAIVLIALTICLFLAISIISQRSILFQEYYLDNFIQIFRTITDISFLGMFVFIVIDFLYFEPPSFLICLIIIIITRISLSKLNQSLAHIHYLNKQNIKINTLLFQPYNFEPTDTHRVRDVWDLFKESSRDSWLPEIIRELIGEVPEKIKINWKHSNQKTTLTFTMEIPAKKRYYLVKLFDLKGNLSALHEASLLSEYATKLPCPPLCLVTKINGYHCHVFDISRLKFIEMGNGSNTKVRMDLAASIMSFHPEQKLIDRYQRSKSTFLAEINTELFTRLALISNEEQTEKIKFIIKVLPNIFDKVNELPLALDIPLNDAFILTDKEGTPYLTDWSQWKLNPIGSGFHMIITRSNLNQVKLSELCSIRNISSDAVNTMKISAMLSLIQIKSKKQAYNEILEKTLPLLYLTIKSNRKEI